MGQPRSCHSWYASAVMASSLTASDTFRSVESVGWLVPLFFGSIFSARLAMIVLLSALLCLFFSSTTSGTFWRSISRRGRVPIVTQDTTPTIVMRPLVRIPSATRPPRSCQPRHQHHRSGSEEWGRGCSAPMRVVADQCESGSVQDANSKRHEAPANDT